MKCILTRKQFRSDGIFGELRDENDHLIAVTLEHAYKVGEEYCAKVDLGTYRCVRHPRSRLPYETFMLEDVPDFQGQPVTGILIHRGNFQSDSVGCILLGESIGQNGPAGAQMILRSRITFDQFMKMQKGLSEFTLIITA